jgi:hypothetical protein
MYAMFSEVSIVYPRMYTFQINFVNCNNSITGKGSKNDGRAMQSVLMEQKLDEKMQHILNNCIQHHQAILR